MINLNCKICGKPAVNRICSECEMQIANRSAKYMPRRMRGSRNLPSSANKNTALHGGIKINSQAVGYHA